MAIKINAVDAQRDLFAAKPDIDVEITLDDGEHHWTLHGGGVLLQSELTRYELATKDIVSMAKNSNDDQQMASRLETEMNANWDRFRSCFVANMTSDDGSAERWIDGSKYDYVTMPRVLQSILTQAGEQ